MYAVPADGEDRHLDDNGTIEGSVSSSQLWLARETGGKAFRMDTYQGALDITFARLSKTGSELAARDRFVREGIEEQLRAMGFTAQNKIYAVYYDGLHMHACADAFWPPALQGNVVATYLRGGPNFARPCSTNRFAAANEAPAYWEYVMVHEVVHGLGFAAACAPHHHRAGHVTAPNDDLMWAGDTGFWTFPAKLDVGKDDHYGHGRADCPDLAHSPYLTVNAFPSKPGAAAAGSARARGATTRSRVIHDDEGSCRAHLPGNFLRLDAHIDRATCRRALDSGRPNAAPPRHPRCVPWGLPENARGRLLAGAVKVTGAGGSATREVLAPDLLAAAHSDCSEGRNRPTSSPPQAPRVPQRGRETGVARMVR